MIWSCVIWLKVFQTDYDAIELIMTKNKLWRHFSDAIVITSAKNITKVTTHDISILDPFKFRPLATPVKKFDMIDTTEMNF